MVTEGDNVPEQHKMHKGPSRNWVSQDARHHQEFMRRTVEDAEKSDKDLHPSVAALKHKVYNDSRLLMLFQQMFEQVPKNKKYLTDPSGQMPTMRDFDQMLKVANHLVTVAPKWTDAGHSVGLVGLPFMALFDWPMGTQAGFVVFQDPEVNGLLKNVLNAWGDYLKTDDSKKCLHKDDKEGWFSEHGLKALEEVANKASGTNAKYPEMFECDPSDECYGYKSWDDFFTRPLKESFRPVAEPNNDDVVVNGCESKVYKVSTNVSARERFWIKGQPYSVIDMLANDPLAEQFVGGTIYQAFLSALSYHRWHSPISGTVKKAYLVPGTYYSEPMYEEFAPGKEADKEGETNSQEYLSVMAARAHMFIEADNPKIGLMCVQAVGMTEVSTCEMTVKEGQHINKGDQLGMFHFGGSTWTALFRKGVKLEGFPQPSREENVPVRSELCRVI